MNIALASDNNYAIYLHIVIVSILDHNKNNEINIYIIDSGITEENKKRIKKSVDEYSQKIRFIDANSLVGDLQVDNSFPLSAYSRLFLTRLEDIDKIIYFDTDSLINGNLVDLWNIDLSSKYFAGVLDFVESYYRPMIGLPSSYPYINSGMLFMNLRKMRNDGWEDKVLEMIKRYKGSIPHHDQGIINALGNGKTVIVNPKYNVIADYIFQSIPRIFKRDVFGKYYTSEDIKEARENPVFIHFTASFYGRPWDIKCTSPLKHLYHDMIEKAGYKLEDVLVDLPENKHMVFIRNIYKKYPYWIYQMVYYLISLRKRIIWTYRLRDVKVK